MVTSLCQNTSQPSSGETRSSRVSFVPSKFTSVPVHTPFLLSTKYPAAISVSPTPNIQKRSIMSFLRVASVCGRWAAPARRLRCLSQKGCDDRLAAVQERLDPHAHRRVPSTRAHTEADLTTLGPFIFCGNGILGFSVSVVKGHSKWEQNLDQLREHRLGGIVARYSEIAASA
jgi:hypothetical protein